MHSKKLLQKTSNGAKLEVKSEPEKMLGNISIVYYTFDPKVRINLIFFPSKIQKGGAKKVQKSGVKFSKFLAFLIHLENLYFFNWREYRSILGLFHFQILN